MKRTVGVSGHKRTTPTVPQSGGRIPNLHNL
ncbi:hypothetical protein CBM2633_A110070 [Cupriavidus taiwanensis]|nr:hypothetical protein CBM2633_A110070 [Cupriavidus taiwanensis]